MFDRYCAGEELWRWLARRCAFQPLEGQACNAEETGTMRIGEAARLSGVSAKLIRYYEAAELLSPAGRDANGYRIFDERNVHELRFIKRSRSLGFPIKQIDELLKLWRDKKRPSRKVRAFAELHKQSVADRMNAHRSIIKVLSRLIAACKGDDRPDCPILDELSSQPGKRD